MRLHKARNDQFSRKVDNPLGLKIEPGTAIHNDPVVDRKINGRGPVYKVSIPK
jgi:hypothetical protein